MTTATEKLMGMTRSLLEKSQKLLRDSTFGLIVTPSPISPIIPGLVDLTLPTPPPPVLAMSLPPPSAPLLTPPPLDSSIQPPPLFGESQLSVSSVIIGVAPEAQIKASSALIVSVDHEKKVRTKKASLLQDSLTRTLKAGIEASPTSVLPVIGDEVESTMRMLPDAPRLKWELRFGKGVNKLGHLLRDDSVHKVFDDILKADRDSPFHSMV